MKTLKLEENQAVTLVTKSGTVYNGFVADRASVKALCGDRRRGVVKLNDTRIRAKGEEGNMIEATKSFIVRSDIESISTG